MAQESTELIPAAKINNLSASKIKTYESCSWLYWVNYHLDLPKSQNDGARKGDVCHRIFELLLDKKHKQKYKRIVSANTITAVPSIKKLIIKYSKEIELVLTDEVFKQIDEMILVGLVSDFFVKGGKLVAPEFEFKIQNKDPKYNIRGFMDKPFIVGNEIIIDDFKSSKKKFEGEDKESNMQALMYSLAARKLWPDLTPHIRFIFLQYPEDPIVKISFSQESLNGFELYLESIQEKIDNFTEKHAKSSYAYDHDDPTGGEFKGKIMCGFCKAPGELKKDGKKKWHCAYKFPFNYYISTSGEKKKAIFEEDFHKLKEEQKPLFEAKKYDGCPRFNAPDRLIGFNTAVSETKKYRNVLDDF